MKSRKSWTRSLLMLIRWSVVLDSKTTFFNLTWQPNSPFLVPTWLFKTILLMICLSKNSLMVKLVLQKVHTAFPRVRQLPSLFHKDIRLHHLSHHSQYLDLQVFFNLFKSNKCHLQSWRILSKRSTYLRKIAIMKQLMKKMLMKPNKRWLRLSDYKTGLMRR